MSNMDSIIALLLNNIKEQNHLMFRVQSLLEGKSTHSTETTRVQAEEIKTALHTIKNDRKNNLSIMDNLSNHYMQRLSSLCSLPSVYETCYPLIKRMQDQEEDAEAKRDWESILGQLKGGIDVWKWLNERLCFMHEKYPHDSIAIRTLMEEVDRMRSSSESSS